MNDISHSGSGIKRNKSHRALRNDIPRPNGKKSPNSQMRYSNSIQKSDELYKKKDERSQYHELLRAYFKQQEDEEIAKQCTFKPKINPSSQCRMYFYESSEEDGTKHKANVIKRNELWKKSKEDKIGALKQEQELQIQEEWTFAPNVNSNGKDSTLQPHDLLTYSFRYELS